MSSVQITDRFIAFVFQHILKYRSSVIRENLTSAFDYQDAKQLNEDIRRNYLFLAKVLRQILVRPGKKLLLKRMQLYPCPDLDKWLSENKSVLITFGHIGNWEWSGSFVGLKYPDQVSALYKKIKSGYVNSLMMKRRLTHVNYLIESGQLGDLLRLIRKKPMLILMIADQNPGSDQGIIWAPFFGRETAFVNGPETLALRYHLPVVYMEIQSGQKGSYTLNCQPIYDGQEIVKPGEITKRFASHLENNIRKNRMEWLWSHKRWKRKKT